MGCIPTADEVDLVGDGVSSWIGDFNAAFVEQSVNPADGSYTRLGGRMIWYNDAATLNQDGGDGGNVAANHVDGVHFVWTFDAADHYLVETFTIGGAPLQSFTGTISDVANIGGFRVGLWDTEQTATIENFLVTVPEPSSLLLCLGRLALVVIRRRRR
jgi:hypothetical protein